jgi:hypothetical protein
MGAKLPAMQWYPGDWRKDPGVQALSYEERGVWFELLMLMHDCEDRGKLMLNGKPIEHKRLSVMLRLTEGEITEHITQYITLGVASVCPDTGALMCRRMVRDEQKRATNAANGGKGGNPAFQKGKDNPYYNRLDNRQDNPTDNREDNPKISPSSSSSSSSSIQTHTEPSAVPASVSEKKTWITQRNQQWFEEWWAFVWLKVGRGQAEKAFRKVNTPEMFEAVMEATKKQAVVFLAREPQFRPHPATWLNGKRWLDEAPKVETSNGQVDEYAHIPLFDWKAEKARIERNKAECAAEGE